MIKSDNFTRGNRAFPGPLLLNNKDPLDLEHVNPQKELLAQKIF